MNCVWNLWVSAVALKCKYTHLAISRMFVFEARERRLRKSKQENEDK